MATIDHILSCEIPEEHRGNELNTLAYLATGLNALASQVSRLEEPIRQKERAQNSRIMFFGNAPELPPGAVAMLPCFFHWFGVSICNYARLTGFLTGLVQGVYDREALENPAAFELIDKHCTDYVSSIPMLAPVLAWRNKIAAHFAITAPRKNSDNPASLDFSVMYPVGYVDSRFRVNTMVFQRTDSDGNLHTGRMDPWSVTEVYEELSSRYWPSNG